MSEPNVNGFTTNWDGIADAWKRGAETSVAVGIRNVLADLRWQEDDQGYVLVPARIMQALADEIKASVRVREAAEGDSLSSEEFSQALYEFYEVCDKLNAMAPEVLAIVEGL
jgi:hypothetical protein